MEDPMSRLTHDLIAEILSRVPYKSICICKCVSPAWRDIIADPAYRKKIAQSLAGFFYQFRVVEEGPVCSDSGEPRWLSIRGVKYVDLSAFSWSSVPRTSPRLPLPVPPPEGTDCFFYLKDSCDGLFLTSSRFGDPELRSRYNYMVSNPATGEYALLPYSGYPGEWYNSYLGFDSGVSTEEFHVFEFGVELPQDVRDPWAVREVKIYSSKTGVWVSMESQWDIQVSLCWDIPGVFHKGCLYLLTEVSGLAMVDTQGLKWRTIPVPDSDGSGFIGKSAGQIFYISYENQYGTDLISTVSVYALSVEVYHRDNESMHWKLLYEKELWLGSNLKLIGVHPHANMIFMINSNNELLAYDLDHHESTTVYHIEHNCETQSQFVPYVPLSSPLPLDGGMQLATPHRYREGCDVPGLHYGGNLGAEVPIHCLQFIYQRVCRAAPFRLRRLLRQLFHGFRQRCVN